MKISLDPCLYFIKVWKVKLFTIEKLEKVQKTYTTFFSRLFLRPRFWIAVKSLNKELITLTDLLNKE